jgi:catechol 2,3-dioxygenase-like lactoylglutathione lyase family enzyme
MAFVAVTDLERAREFYIGALGLPVVESDPTTVVVNANGTPLRITRIEGHRPTNYTVIGWAVDDIDELAQELIDRGLRFDKYENLDQDEHGVWTGPNGNRIGWFEDPDGNILSLTQFHP